MTLITAVNEVADIVNLDQFDSVYGSDDPNAQTMLAMAKEAGDEIARRVDWQTMLRTTTAVSSPHTLPTDFQRPIPGGAMRTAAGVFGRSVTSGSQWSVIAAAGSLQPFYFIRSDAVLVSPTSAAVGATIEYVSKNWIIGDPYAEKDEFSSDGDTTSFPERLLVKAIVWRWKRQKGLAYEDNLAEFEADLAQEIVADRGVS